MNQNNENCECTKINQWLIISLIVVGLISTPFINYLVIKKQNKILLEKIKKEEETEEENDDIYLSRGSENNDNSQFNNNKNWGNF